MWEYCIELEPPVPPGLKELSAPLAEFVRFFQLDPFLVQAAAQASQRLRPAPAPAVDALIPRLPRAECDAFLRRLAAGEPLLALKFNRRLQELAGPPARPQAAPVRRTWAELRETAEGLRQAEERRQQVEAEARRIKDLQEIALAFASVEANSQVKSPPAPCKVLGTRPNGRPPTPTRYTRARSSRLA